MLLSSSLLVSSFCAINYAGEPRSINWLRFSVLLLFFSLAFVCSFSLTAYLFNFYDINDDQVLCQCRLVDVLKWSL